MAIPMTSSVDKLPLKTNGAVLDGGDGTDGTDDVIVKEIIDYVKDGSHENHGSHGANNNVPNASTGPQHVLPPIQHIPNTTLPPQSYPNQYEYLDINMLVLCAIIVFAIVVIQNTDFLNMFIEYSNIDMFKTNPLYLQYGVIFVIIYVIQKNNIYK